jgi:Fe-S-cluster containining protein
MPLSGVDIHFECTRCGNFCRNSRLALTIAEAETWLDDGHDVQVLCEATPWLTDPAHADAIAQHRLRRSFSAASGELPLRIVVILAANLVGACPNLGPDDLCRIHARRPLVCRIYPAEINPFVALVPGNKGCPAEAWKSDLPILQRAGRIVDARLATTSAGHARPTPQTSAPSGGCARSSKSEMRQSPTKAFAHTASVASRCCAN